MFQLNFECSADGNTVIPKMWPLVIRNTEEQNLAAVNSG